MGSAAGRMAARYILRTSLRRIGLEGDWPIPSARGRTDRTVDHNIHVHADPLANLHTHANVHTNPNADSDKNFYAYTDSGFDGDTIRQMDDPPSSRQRTADK
jgi:hypothetical protein